MLRWRRSLLFGLIVGLNLPGIPETVLVESRLDEAGLLLLIVHLFEFGRWYVANRSQEPLLVEPGHPVESGELDIVDSLPRAVLSNDLGLVQPITDSTSALSWESPRLPTEARSRIRRAAPWSGSTDTGYRGRCEESDRRCWNAPKGPAPQSIQGDVGLQRVHDPPTDDLSGEHVDDKGDVNEVAPGGRMRRSLADPTSRFLADF